MALYSRQIPVNNLVAGYTAVLSGTAASSGATPPTDVSAPEVKASSPSQGVAPVVAAMAGAVFVVALGLALWARDADGVQFTAQEGLSAFAVFYVAAQSAERFVEMLLPLLDKWAAFAKTDAKNAVEAAVAESQAMSAAEAQAKLDRITANRSAIAFAGTAAFGMILCAYLEADFLAVLGISFGDSPTRVNSIVTLVITGLVLGGGSKGLHDLITNMSKAAAAKSTPPETGGAK